MPSFQRLALVVAGVAGFAAPAIAQQQAVTINSGSLFVRGTFQNFGWSFTIDHTATVGALGIFDYQGNGLVDEHQVGLWDSSHNLLATAMISSADALTPGLGGGFRFESIDELVIGPGTYVLGAHYTTVGEDGDPFVGQATYTLAGGLTFGETLVTVGAIEGFSEPVSPSASGAEGYFGPNLLFVPEPATWAMMIAGFGLIGGALRKRPTLHPATP